LTSFNIFVPCQYLFIFKVALNMLWRVLFAAIAAGGWHWYNMAGDGTGTGGGGGGIVDAWCNNSPLFSAFARPHLTKSGSNWNPLQSKAHGNLASRRFLAITTGDGDTDSLASSSSPFLVATTTPPFAEIIGSGRIGELLASAGACTVLRRGGDAIDIAHQGCPVIIATRNDALEGIVAACPPERRADLVFVQNGYLDSFLEQHQLSDNTQALLYLSVPAKGVAPVDGVTRVNPDGLTAATGVHAAALAQRLAAVGMKCNVVAMSDYRPAMFEKLMYVRLCRAVSVAQVTRLANATCDGFPLVLYVALEFL
jgi:hypothetical protein